MTEDTELVQPPRKGRAALFVTVPLAIVMVLLVGVLITRKSAADRADYDPLTGKPAPEIVGTTLDGKPFNLDQYRGEWVVVNFFAQWCVPCQQEQADLVAFNQRHATGEGRDPAHQRRVQRRSRQGAYVLRAERWRLAGGHR